MTDTDLLKCSKGDPLGPQIITRFFLIPGFSFWPDFMIKLIEKIKTIIYISKNLESYNFMEYSSRRKRESISSRLCSRDPNVSLYQKFFIFRLQSFFKRKSFI